MQLFRRRPHENQSFEPHQADEASEVESRYQHEALNRELGELVQEYMREDAEDALDTEEVEYSPIVRLANTILMQAVKQQASEVILRQNQRGVRILSRFDQTLFESMRMPSYICKPLFARFREMAELPPVGDFSKLQNWTSITYDSKSYDIRVSVAPTVTGETIAMRIRDDRFSKDLSEAGVGADLQETLQSLLERKSGVLIVNGFRGDGMTSLLRALIAQCQPDLNNCVVYGFPEVVTSNLTHIGPEQVERKGGWLWDLLKHQQIDVLMLDAPTPVLEWEKAFEFAERGSLVLMGINGRDGCEAISRFSQSGIQSDRIERTLLGVLTQRLARKVCPDCGVEEVVSAESVRQMGMPENGTDTPTTFRKGQGCDACRESGCLGMTAIHEFLDSHGNAVASLKDAALEKAVSGTISLNEAIKVIKG